MGTFLIGYAFIALLVGICVTQLCAGLRAHYRLPAWLPAALVALIMLAFLLVPMDSQAAVSAFSNTAL